MVLLPAWGAQDWFALGPGVHNATVTITYPNGTALKAIVLSHDDHEIRAIAAGCGDVLAFSCIHGTWISAALEPVTIQFEWQPRGAPTPTSEDDWVCPKELAAGLIQTLFGGGDLDDATGEALYLFRPEGSHVATFRTEQLPS